MSLGSAKRKEVVASLVPSGVETLLDIGCGPLSIDYVYAKLARRVTCVDWKFSIVGPAPINVELIEANFIDLNLPNREFDVIIASDVFEHVLREDEKEFVKKCLKLLRPGGTLVVSMPNLGTFAWLDPYQIKPLLHWLRWRIGLPQALHNGFCDIRKGHKHYTVAEIANSFEPLVISRVEYWGYCFDPILSWWEALSNRLGFQMPGQTWLSRLCVSEYSRDFGDRSFNIAVQLKKQNRD